MGNQNNPITALVLGRNYLDEATLQECLLELEIGDGSKNLLDLLYQKKLIPPKDYQDLKLAFKLSQTDFREEQEELLLAKLLQDAGLVNQISLEKAFLKKEKYRSQGSTIHLSEILLDMGVIDKDQIDEASHLVQKMEVQCEKCQKKFTLAGLDRNASLQCPHCAFILLPDTSNMDLSEMMATMAPSTHAPSPLGLGDTVDEIPGEHRDVTAIENFETMDGRGHTGDQTSTTDHFLGKKLGGCRLTKKLGQGGMGAVYLGENLSLGRKEAIKILTSDVAASPEQLLRFQREARAAGTLQSPHIVQVLNIGEDQGIHYISMEFVDGQSMQDLIDDAMAKDEKVPLELALNYIKQSAMGLLAAHNKEIIHRDIKPDNLMISNEGVVKVADFGLARKIEDTMGITQSGAIMGTPYYMSPEQCGGRPTDQRSDIYSLGATLFYMLTGQHPFKGETPMAILLKHMNQEVTPPHQLDPSIPLSLSHVIEKMMEKDPQYRYQSLDEFLEDIQKVEEGEDIGVSAGKKKRIFRRRIKGMVILLLFTGVASLIYYLATAAGGVDPEVIKSEYKTVINQLDSQYDGAIKQSKAGKKTNWAEVLELANQAAKYEDQNAFLQSSKSKKFLYQIYLHQAIEAFQKAQLGLAQFQTQKENISSSLRKAHKYFRSAQETKYQKADLNPWFKKESELYLAMGQKYLQNIDFSSTKEMLDQAGKTFENIKITQTYKTLKENLEQAKKEGVVQQILLGLAKRLGLSASTKALISPSVANVLRELSPALLGDIPLTIKKARENSPSAHQEQVIEKLYKRWEKEGELRRDEKGLLENLKTALLQKQTEKDEVCKALDETFSKKKVSLKQAKNTITKLEELGRNITPPQRDPKAFAKIHRQPFQSIKNSWKKEAQDVAKRLISYKRKGEFVQKYQQFLEDYKNPTYKKNIYRAIQKAEKDLIQLVKLAYGDSSVYRKAIEQAVTEIRGNIFDLIYEKAKDELDTDRFQAEIILMEALRVMTNTKAEELLAKIRTPMEFSYIPPGKYEVGSRNLLLQNKVRNIELPSFYMATHEVTNGEYSHFVLDRGYYQQKYWSGGRNLFLSSKGKKALYKPFPEGWAKLLQQDKKGMISFRSPPEKEWKNLPVRGVCFYEAQAYSKWLSQKLREGYLFSLDQEDRSFLAQAKLPPSLRKKYKENNIPLKGVAIKITLVNPGNEWKISLQFNKKKILYIAKWEKIWLNIYSDGQRRSIIARLPSRAEWEVSASYGPSNTRKKRYPWGETFPISLKKYFEGESPLTIKNLSKDISDFGCYDMAGNVSEWVRQDRFEGTCGGLRGASFDSTNPKIQARCNFGGFHPRPENRFEDVGFRICIETKTFKKP